MQSLRTSRHLPPRDLQRVIFIRDAALPPAVGLPLAAESPDRLVVPASLWLDSFRASQVSVTEGVGQQQTPALQ